MYQNTDGQARHIMACVVGIAPSQLQRRCVVYALHLRSAGVDRDIWFLANSLHPDNPVAILSPREEPCVWQLDFNDHYHGILYGYDKASGQMQMLEQFGVAMRKMKEETLYYNSEDFSIKITLPKAQLDRISPDSTDTAAPKTESKTGIPFLRIPSANISSLAANVPPMLSTKPYFCKFCMPPKPLKMQKYLGDGLEFVLSRFCSVQLTPKLVSNQACLAIEEQLRTGCVLANVLEEDFEKNPAAYPVVLGLALQANLLGVGVMGSADERRTAISQHCLVSYASVYGCVDLRARFPSKYWTGVSREAAIAEILTSFGTLKAGALYGHDTQQQQSDDTDATTHEPGSDDGDDDEKTQEFAAAAAAVAHKCKLLLALQASGLCNMYTPAITADAKGQQCLVRLIPKSIVHHALDSHLQNSPNATAWAQWKMAESSTLPVLTIDPERLIFPIVGVPDITPALSSELRGVVDAQPVEVDETDTKQVVDIAALLARHKAASNASSRSHLADDDQSPLSTVVRQHTFCGALLGQKGIKRTDHSVKPQPSFRVHDRDSAWQLLASHELDVMTKTHPELRISYPRLQRFSGLDIASQTDAYWFLPEVYIEFGISHVRLGQGIFLPGFAAGLVLHDPVFKPYLQQLENVVPCAKQHNQQTPHVPFLAPLPTVQPSEQVNYTHETAPYCMPVVARWDAEHDERPHREFEAYCSTHRLKIMDRVPLRNACYPGVLTLYHVCSIFVQRYHEFAHESV